MSSKAHNTTAAYHNDVAIIGMACTFPRARNLSEYWQNIVRGVSAVDDPKPGRWDTEAFFDPHATGGEKIYCKKGGYLESPFSFKAAAFGTMPRAVEGAEPDQFLVLRTAQEAIADAGYLDRDLDGRRGAFILGRGNYLGAGLTNLFQRGQVTEQTLRILRSLHPDLSAEDLDAIRRELRADLPGFGPDTAAGMIPNITAGRVANRLDLMGPTYTVDAACASSLIATQQALAGLIHNQFDLALAGGVHVFTNVPLLQVFSAMGALSRSGVIRPFDKNCDGTVPGEGVGLLVLKRLADAQRDGDRIYAVIKGVGVSSDGRAMSVTAPRLDGEILAVQRAYEAADIPPQTVEMIEAHGTATPVGDPTEVEALLRVFGRTNGQGPWCAIGSVKSMIGHAMPAAGAAGLIKTALALYHRVLPPTLNCQTPAEPLLDPDCPFYVNTEARPWIHGDDRTPRRAGVNAFGFGGINAHVVLEEYTAAATTPRRSPTSVSSAPAVPKAATRTTHPATDQTDETSAPRPSLLRDWECELIILESETRDSLAANIDQLHTYLVAANGIALRDLAFTLNTSLTGAAHRLAIVATSITDLDDKLTRAAGRLRKKDTTRIRDNKGIYYFDPNATDLHNGKVAFLFPGLGAQYTNMLADLCLHLPEVVDSFDAADRAIKVGGERPLSADVFPPPAFSDEARETAESRLAGLERANPAVLTANGAMFLLLDRLGIRPDMMTGHSSGEWVALPAAGMVPVDQFIAGMSRLQDMWRDLTDNRNVLTRVMLAVGTDRETIARIADELDRPIQLANDNCRHQVLVVVHPDDADAVSDALRRRNIFVERLPYEHGYHTPEFTYVTDALREYFSSLPLTAPNTTVYSGATAEPYPADRTEIIEQLAHTFASPLRFRDTIERMYNDGARVFIEVGPRGNLSAFVDDILRGRPHLCVPTNKHRQSGLAALHHALGTLAALGVHVDLAPLYTHRQPQRLTLDADQDRAIPEHEQPGTIAISLDSPLLKLAPRPQRAPAEPTTAMPRSRMAATGGDAPPIDPAAERASDRSRTSAPNVSREAPVTAPRNGQATAGHSDDDAARAMQDHMRTMETFLHTQEEIMAAYLGHRPTATAPVPAAPPTTHNDSEHVPYETAPQTPAAPPQPRETQTQRQPTETAVTAEETATADHRPAPPPATAPSLTDALLEIVSDKTGYPVDMIDLDADMEADLGIDSIKRIEILGALQQRQPQDSPEVDMEAVARIKTLRAIVAFIEQSLGTDTASTDRPRSPAADTNDEKNTGYATVIPFAGRIIEHVPGNKITVQRAITLAEDLYLRDHCFDHDISDADPGRDRLPIVPLTVSIEMMAGVADLLVPDKKLPTARNIQAGKWIDVDSTEGEVILNIIANRQNDEVHVTIRRADDDTAAADKTPILAQAVYTFADGYPSAPTVEPFTPASARTPSHTAEQMYAEARMFHGPRFRGVVSLDEIGEDGLLAQLEVLPTDNLLASTPSPQFHFDPFLLDAAGQLVGYWPVEYLEEGFVLFPLRVRELIRYRDNLGPGQRATCHLRIREVNHRQLRADMDIIAPDGTIWMRVIGWEDWRFYWPRRFYDFWRFPKTGMMTEPLTMPAPAMTERIECRRMAPMGEMGTSIWDKLWAHLILSRRELTEFRAIPTPQQRTTWLLGRAAAKDAVRAWIQRHHGLDLYPADVEITHDPNGRPLATGHWLDQVGQAPRVTISHKDNVAVAAAADATVGIDLETATDRANGFNRAAFTSQERAHLATLPDNGWLTRAWCAKEAAGKAAGIGLTLGPHTMRIERVNPATGEFTVAVGESAVAAHPNLRGQQFLVQTASNDGCVYALAVEGDVNVSA